MKKFNWVLFFCVIMLLFISMPQNSSALASSQIDQTNVEAASSDIWDDILNLFVPGKPAKDLGSVIVGGVPLGLSLDSNGVEVVGLTEIITKDGTICPAGQSGLQINDKIISLNGKKTTRISDLAKIANDCKDKEITVEFVRNGENCVVQLKPALDILSGQYKLGLWAKDVSNGVGTLTFVKGDKYFGCLGHPITSNVTGEILEISGGQVHNCTILGVNKGVKGAAGELKGAFSTKCPIGEIFKNNKYGVYGRFSKFPNALDRGNVLKVAPISEVKVGKAKIFTTIEGELPKYYDIEIVKANNQTQKDDKGMVVRVTDKVLLEKAGGIVQGMSGSPIIQNGKLVGAVTHVFINDPTRGFGMFAEWMLTE